MSFIFKSLSGLPPLPSMNVAHKVTIITDSGIFNLEAGDLQTFLVGDLSTRVNSLESVSGYKWAAPRTLSLDGPVVGSVAFDGSGDIQLNVSIGAGALQIGQVSGLSAELLGLREDVNTLIDNGAASAETADRWTTARTLTLTGKAAGSTSIDGSTNVTLNVTGLSGTKSDVGLGNVDNTSDVDKPISTATQAALNLKATTTANSDISGASTGAPMVRRSLEGGTPQGSPHFTWVGNTGTGMRQAAVNVIAFDTQSMERVRISNNGLDVVSGVLKQGGNAVYHVGNLSFGAGLAYNATTGEVTASGDSGLPGSFTPGNYLRAATTTTLEERTPAQVKADLGLSNVSNTSDANKPISTATQEALDQKVSTTLLGVANGVATLDATGKVTASQLPSYIDEVIEATTLSALPVTGESSKIYITLDTNLTYRWTGTAYIEISSAGTADTATRWTAARTITLTGKASGSVAFDGSADFNLNVTALSVNPSDVGLGNVDNTSDLAKPISTATQAALDDKAPLSSPAFTGAPTAPTQALGNNSTRLATTAFVQNTVTDKAPSKTGAGASGTWGIDISGNSNSANALSTGRMISISGAIAATGVLFDGTADIELTATLADGSLSIAKTSGLQSALNTKAPLNSPTFTGVPAGPTAAVGTNSTQFATTAFTKAQIAADAPTKSGTGATGTWGISVSGNASTASLLATPRSFSMTGIVTAAAVSFDGGANVQLTTTIADGALSIAKVSGLQSALDSKALPLGYTPVNVAGDVLQGLLTFPASTTASASLNIPHGAAPSAPVNGDLWTTTGGLFARINGATRTFVHTGTYSTVSQAEAEAGAAGTVRMWTPERVAQAIAAQALTPALLGTANGIATLDNTGKVPANQLPSFVDDVLEYAGFSSFPTTGESGKLYVALNTGKLYRWSGSAYVDISSTSGNADTATQLATARRISLTGVVDSAGALFDGSGDIVLSTSIANGSLTIAKTSGLQAALDALAPIDSPSFTGTPLAPTQAKSNSSTRIATTAFVKAVVGDYAPLASPEFTGTPTAPTAAVGTSNNQLATTEFVGAEITAKAPTKTGGGASGSWPISISGQSATAGKLATARTINGVAFDGSANITLPTPTVSTLTFGNGFATGSFNGSSAATINLGTPGTISGASSNSVSAASHTHALSVTKADVGLSNVDNTSDASKPISTATQNALNDKASIGSSPRFNSVYIGADNNIMLYESSTNKLTLRVGASGAYQYFGFNTDGSFSLNGTVDATRVAVGFDPGVNNAIGCSGWFRSSGNTGWLNSTWGIGVYAADATYVRTYGGAKLMAADFVMSSDESLKANIRDFEYRGRLRPINFTMRSDGSASFGFSANEVQELYPEAVGKLEENGTLTLSYPLLTAVLSYQVNKVEDQAAETRTEIEQLRQQVGSLSDQVAELKELVSRLMS